MHPSTILSALLSLLLAVSAARQSSCPRQLSKRFSESKPWVLSNITVFSAARHSGVASYINFLFTDSNKGIRLSTQCRRTILPGDEPSGVNDPGTYYPCKNSTVNFQYNRGTFHVARSYLDPSVGPPGMDIVTAFGHRRASSTVRDSRCGLWKVSDELKVPITSITAKLRLSELE